MPHKRFLGVGGTKTQTIMCMAPGLAGTRPPRTRMSRPRGAILCLLAHSYYRIRFMLRPKRDWEIQALCRTHANPDDFDSKGPQAIIAQMICVQCPVRIDCLEYALVHEEHGIWGGLTERQRHKMKAVVPILKTQYSVAHLIEERPGPEPQPKVTHPAVQEVEFGPKDDPFANVQNLA